MNTTLVGFYQDLKKGNKEHTFHIILLFEIIIKIIKSGRLSSIFTRFCKQIMLFEYNFVFL